MTMLEHFVYAETTWSKEDPKEIAIHAIPDKSQVLDVGCGVGGFGKWLKQNKKAVVTGIDGHPDAVKEARKNLDSAVKLDLDDTESVKRWAKGKSFEVITFIDVLEHCLYPDKLLNIFREALKPNGIIVVSLPNIAHYSVRWNLAQGRFDYADSGLLDRTHVHFYTKKSALELITDSGFEVQEVNHTSPKSGLKGLVAKLDPTLTAIQFVTVAKKAA